MQIIKPATSRFYFFNSIMVNKEVEEKFIAMYNNFKQGNIMARITSELAQQAVGNRYDLVLIASERTRELMRGDPPLIDSKNSPTVTALREIEQGKVGRSYLLKVRTPEERGSRARRFHK
jgi:DNA-directed RNA polymerase subunit omega